MAEPNGWDASAQAWIDVIGNDGDWGRRHVLDTPMLVRATRGGFRNAIDIGCGEGRFCRMLQAQGIATTGVDPTVALIEQAHLLDPGGDYRVERAEALTARDATYDLAVAYLSLIDIPDLSAAFAQMHRVLRPGGTLLIANLQSFNTASVDHGWSREPDGTRRFSIDHSWTNVRSGRSGAASASRTGIARCRPTSAACSTPASRCSISRSRNHTDPARRRPGIGVSRTF